MSNMKRFLEDIHSDLTKEFEETQTKLEIPLSENPIDYIFFLELKIADMTLRYVDKKQVRREH